MTNVSAILIIVYSFLMLTFCLIWLVNSQGLFSAEDEKCDGVSIIIVVRNEAKNIVPLLESIVIQEDATFEVILIDDDSDDNTVELARGYIGKCDLRIVELSADERGLSPKKSAITKAINYAKFDLIFCTDGDCILPTEILSSYTKIFNNKDIQLISGPVTFTESKHGFWAKIWNEIQIVEFASLLGSAAVSIFINKPSMCSGANLAYRKSVFLEVDGYVGNSDLASGDDEFLMHKVYQKYRNGVKFVKSSTCIVHTTACESLGLFYDQRKRWASKWTHYAALAPRLLAIFVFMVNLATIYLMINNLWALFAVRIVSEFVFLCLILQFLDKGKLIILIPFVQVIYPFYVVFFGLNSLVMEKNYQWKGRKLK